MIDLNTRIRDFERGILELMWDKIKGSHICIRSLTVYGMALIRLRISLEIIPST